MHQLQRIKDRHMNSLERYGAKIAARIIGEKPTEEKFIGDAAPIIDTARTNAMLRSFPKPLFLNSSAAH